MRMIKRRVLLLLVGAFAFAVPPSALSFTQQQQQPETPQRPAVEDPIRELNLSPEQRERIRAIREQLKEERAAINQRLRETNGALEEALDADNPDEALIEQRMRDVSAAQAASMRMRILSEVRIRRVLTPDQLSTLRELRKRARDTARERQRDNVIRRRESFERRQTNPRNTLGPLFRRADPQRGRRP